MRARDDETLEKMGGDARLVADWPGIMKGDLGVVLGEDKGEEKERRDESIEEGPEVVVLCCGGDRVSGWAGVPAGNVTGVAACGTGLPGAFDLGEEGFTCKGFQEFCNDAGVDRPISVALGPANEAWLRDRCIISIQR